MIPHSDGAGRIVAVGPGVDASRLGERVWLWNVAWQRAYGTAAEFVALPAAQAVPLPAGASFADGVSIGIPGMTAHRCLFADGPIAGQDILVTAGAGAVGSYAIQMARLGGARRVIATTSGGVKATHARAMGADAVIDYRAPGCAEAILAASDGRGVDRIIDVEFGGNLDVSRAVLKPNGTIAAYGSMANPEPKLPFYPMMFAGQTLRMVLVYILPPDARARAIRDITGWLEQGALTHPVALSVPMDEAWRAHEACENTQRIGAALIEINPEL